jgi:hypothetical protein
MPKVIIINRAGHDFSAAKKYGDLMFLSEGEQNRFAVGGMYRRFAETIEFSQPDDYLLLTGLTTMSTIAAAMFGYKHGRLNLLLFKNDKYIERKIVLSELLTK